MADEPKTFWGKLAAWTAFLSALAGAGALIAQFGISNPHPSPSPPTPYVQPTQLRPLMCYTPAFSCLMAPGSVPGPCFCVSPLGPVQGQAW